MQLVATDPSSVSVADAVKVNTAPVAPVASPVAFAGTVTTGPVVSFTVTVKVLVPMLAWLSVAVHVTVVAPDGNVAPLAGVQFAATLPSSRSVAEAVKVNTAPAALVASTVAAAGTVRTGPVVSFTVTVNDAAVWLPCASVAPQVTVVAPNGNVAPPAGVQLVATAPSSVSVADAVKVNTAPVALVASTVAFAGTVTTGPVVSLTVTVNVLVPTLAWLSVALHVTVVAPNGNVAPLAGVQLVATGPSSVSVAEPVKVNTAPAALVASTVAFAGTVTTGPVVSVTVTVKDFVPTLAWLSVALHVTVVAPNGNVAPLAGVQLVATGPSSVSAAEAAKVNTAPVAPVASTVAFAGTVRTGPVVSFTVTVNDAAVWLPCASVTPQVTVVAPNGNVAPLAGAQLVATGPSRVSVADAVKVKTAPAALVASTLAFAGTVTMGPVVSVTITMKVLVPTLA